MIVMSLYDELSLHDKELMREGKLCTVTLCLFDIVKCSNYQHLEQYFLFNTTQIKNLIYFDTHMQKLLYWLIYSEKNIR